MLLASFAELIFALHQWPLFADANSFTAWYWRATFASLFGLYAGLTVFVVNLLLTPPSRLVLRLNKLYLLLVIPGCFYIFGVYDFTNYISVVYAHQRITVNALTALVVNIGLAAVLVRRFYLLQAQLIQNRLQSNFQLERARLTERHCIMSDIHDTVGAQLVGMLAMIRSGTNHAQLERQTASALEELRIAIDAIQPINGNLAAVLATLRHRLQPRLEGAGLTLVWRVDDLPRLSSLSPQTVQHIQRIVMEALSNIIQHAKASEVKFCAMLTNQGKEIEISISDNGVGFDAKALLSSGNAGQGLSNLQFRAAQIGAKLRFEAKSEIVLCLPV